jgi:hypothetical protein
MIFRRLSAFVVLSIALLCLGTQVPANGAGTPLDNREHPRLWLSSSTTPELRTRLAGPLKAQFQEFVRFVDSEFDTVSGAGDYYFGIRNYGFLYVLGPVSGVSYGHTQAQYGAKAAELLRNFVAGGGGVSGSEGDATIQLFATGYDWLYPLLNGADRSAIVGRLKTIATQPAGPGGNKSAFHHREIKERMLYVLAGLVYANDGIDDADANARLSEYSSYISGDGGTQSAENFIAGRDGGVSVGMSYAVNGVSDGLAISTIQFDDAWRTAHGTSRDIAFSNTNLIRYLPQWVAYSVTPFKRPDGAQILYPTHEMDRGSPSALYFDLPVTVSSARLYRDIDPQMAGLAEWLTQNQTAPVPTSGTLARRSAVLGNFLFNPGNVTPLSPVDLNLPLTKLFRGLGWLAMRTGWTDPGDTQVTFIASPFTRKPAYANVDQGSFTIDRNGPLAIHAGSGIHHSFIETARGYNTIMFTNPQEPVGSWPEYWDMGGQRGLFAIPAGVSNVVRGSQWDIGGIKRQDLYDNTAAHDYDYAFADVTRAYNGPANFDAYNTQKVKQFSRQFVYFRRATAGDSDRIIVFDRTETIGTQFEKRWLFHPPGKQNGTRSFTISGASNVTAGPSRNGTTAGKQTYSQPDVVTITNTENGSNGRLFWKPLLPASRVIVEVGGPDSSGKYDTAGSHEFEDAYGKQQIDFGSYQLANSQYVGHYTLELQPASVSLNDLFLNVFEATTPSQGSLTTTTLINGPKTVGAAIGDRMALFNRTEGYVANDTITVSRGGTYRVLFCDLQPGMNYTINGQAVVAGSGGTAYLTINVASGGTISISSTGVVTQAAPGAPTGVRIIRQ